MRRQSSLYIQSLLALGCVAPSISAYAQLWSPLDVVPRPNMVVGFDTSVSMTIARDQDLGVPGIRCSGYVCHNPPWGFNDIPMSETRFAAAQENVVATLPEFADYFSVGGFIYQGCNYARVTARVNPSLDRNASLNATVNMISGAIPCWDGEYDLPPHDLTVSYSKSPCLAPGATCGEPEPDELKLREFLSGANNVPGIEFEPLPNTDFACDWVGGGWIGRNFNVLDEAVREFQEGINWGHFRWPNWTTASTAAEFEPFCNDLRTILRSVYDDLWYCAYDDRAVWNTSFLSTDWCRPADMFASVSPAAACASGWAGETCICLSPADPVCNPPGAPVITGTPAPRCNAPPAYPYRQQLGICELGSDGDTSEHAYAAFFAAQPDNYIHRASDPTACRENIGILMTDGVMTNTDPGTLDAEAAGMRDLYASATIPGDFNLFVFNPAKVADFDANGSIDDNEGRHFETELGFLAGALTGGLRTDVFDAGDPVTFGESLVRLLNRTYKGVYAASAPAFDHFGQRAARMHFAVPGHNADPALPGDRYLGRPARISWHNVDPDGNLDPAPLWETDWESTAGAIGPSSPSANPIRYLCAGATSISEAAPSAASPCGANDRRWIGPNGPFRNNRMREFSVPADSVDRSGDDVPDEHPALRYGYMFGDASAQPVVVGRPREIPAGPNAIALSMFLQSPAVTLRPQVIYVLSNGYLHAIHAGEPVDGSFTFGSKKLLSNYNDDPDETEAGREIFRYRAPWLDTVENAERNDWIQQPLLTGQLVVREVALRSAADAATPADQFATVLVMNQGRHGRGYAALDITNPYEPVVIHEITLPVGEIASASPTIYPWPSAGVDAHPSVPIASGTSKIHLWDLRTRSLSSLDLGAGDEYFIEPVCLGKTTEVSLCYVLGRRGTLWRVEATSSGFEAPVKLDFDSSDVQISGDGREFWTRPVLFYDEDNTIGIAFGSGRPLDLAEPSTRPERFYRIRDAITRGGTATGKLVCDPNTGGDRLGQIDLGVGQVISAPAVHRGVLFFTTYHAASTNCVAGEAKLWAMRTNDCADAVTTAARPVPQLLGEGLPTSPQIMTHAQRILVETSHPTAPRTMTMTPVSLPGGTRKPLRWIFFRNLSDTR